MTKKLLLLPEDDKGDNFAYYVEKKRSGNEYYMKRVGKNRYTSVSKVDMQLIVRKIVATYGYIYYRKATSKERVIENLERVRKLAPELLPKFVSLTDSDIGGAIWRIVSNQNFCPPGYEFVPMNPKRTSYGDILIGNCSLL